MAFTKRVRAKNISHQEKAILEHAGFVRFVSGKVKRYGLGKVLSAKAPKNDEHEDIVWLKKALMRVLDFAEQVQLKDLSKPLVDNSTHKHFVSFEIPKGIIERGKNGLETSSETARIHERKSL